MQARIVTEPPYEQISTYLLKDDFKIHEMVQKLKYQTKFW